MAKFADLIDHDRNGVPHSADKQRMMRLLVTRQTCAACHQPALCAYAIIWDAYFCSDECVLDYAAEHATA